MNTLRKRLMESVVQTGATPAQADAAIRVVLEIIDEALESHDKVLLSSKSGKSLIAKKEPLSLWLTIKVMGAIFWECIRHPTGDSSIYVVNGKIVATREKRDGIKLSNR